MYKKVFSSKSFLKSEYNNAYLYVRFGSLPGIFGKAAVHASSCFENTETDANGQLWNLISTPAELDCVRNDLDGNFKLTNDITKEELDNYLMDPNTQMTKSWEPIEGADGEAFTGSLMVMVIVLTV